MRARPASSPIRTWARRARASRRGDASASRLRGHPGPASWPPREARPGAQVGSGPPALRSPKTAPGYLCGAGCRKLRQGGAGGRRVGFPGMGVGDPATRAQHRIAWRHLARSPARPRRAGLGTLRRRSARWCRPPLPRSPNRLRPAASKMLRSVVRREARRGFARGCMVDTPRSSARLATLKKCVFSRGSTSLRSSAWLAGTSLATKDPEPLRLPRMRTGTPMQVAESLTGSRRLRNSSMRADALQRHARWCSCAKAQGAVEAPEGVSASARVRHGSCLLVQPKVALPVGGGVNEEMAA
jgi:hypothetical protein